MAETREIRLEAAGSQPNFRYDIIQPLLHGRVKTEGFSIRPTGPFEMAKFFDDPRFKAGEFDLIDTNWGDVLQQIEAGWDIRCLPVFIKRKPAHAYLWVRTDRGIDAPKDLEGKVIGTGSYRSAMSIFTRGFLQHDHGLDLKKLRWLSIGRDRADLAAAGIQITYPDGPPKSAAQRLLDGEIDACTGDITDAKLWAALEASRDVKRMFPDYQERTRALWEEKKISTVVHLIVIGGRLDRAEPEMARTLYDAFQQSKEIAYQDCLGDGTSYSPLLFAREKFRYQQSELGDVYPYGIAANRAMIDAFLDYNHEQHLTARRLTIEEVFARSTLET